MGVQKTYSSKFFLLDILTPSPPTPAPPNSVFGVFNRTPFSNWRNRDILSSGPHVSGSGLNWKMCPRLQRVRQEGYVSFMQSMVVLRVIYFCRKMLLCLDFQCRLDLNSDMQNHIYSWVWLLFFLFSNQRLILETSLRVCLSLFFSF